MVYNCQYLITKYVELYNLLLYININYMQKTSMCIIYRQKYGQFTGGIFMPRRGENIYKRKDGRWEGRYADGYYNNGKKMYRSVYAQSYTEIKEKLRYQISNPISTKNNQLLSHYAINWLENVKMSKKISTYNKYKNIYFLHIGPIIGNLRLDFINEKHIKRIIDNISLLSPKTQNDIICVMKIIFEYAVNNGGKINISMKGYNIKPEYSKTRILSVDEQRIFTAVLLNNINLYKMGIYLSLCTGIRIGELCALRKENLCLKTKQLFIRKTVQRVQTEDRKTKTEIIISDPKSRSSVRDIPLPEFLIELCNKLYGKLQPDDFLLTGKNKCMEPRALQYHFKKYLNECNLENINFHALRHTFATRCVENGFEIKTLSEILGHVNVNITLNRYVHSSIDLKRANMEKLNSVF